MGTSKQISLSNFSFTFTGYGHYKVVYCTPVRGDYWVATIDDMPLIDSTKNEERPKTTDLIHLRNLVKLKGTHYTKKGEKMYW